MFMEKLIFKNKSASSQLLTRKKLDLDSALWLLANG